MVSKKRIEHTVREVIKVFASRGYSGDLQSCIILAEALKRLGAEADVQYGYITHAEMACSRFCVITDKGTYNIHSLIKHALDEMPKELLGAPFVAGDADADKYPDGFEVIDQDTDEEREGHKTKLKLYKTYRDQGFSAFCAEIRKHAGRLLGARGRAASMFLEIVDAFELPVAE